MKALLFTLLMLSSSLTLAADEPAASEADSTAKSAPASKEAVPEEWQNTTLTDETIKKIQAAQYKYKMCVSDAMRKPENAKLESRNATDAIIRQCEPVLTDLRQVYLEVSVPSVIADRHLKKLRIEITRKVLQQMMYSEAARATGQP